MPEYKNVGRTEQKFRAAASTDKPNVKKVYTCAPGKTVDVPVEILAQNMEKVDTKTENTKRKK